MAQDGQNKTFNQEVEVNGNTILHIASEYNQLAVVQSILDQGLVDVNIFNNAGYSAFSMDCWSGYIEVAKLFAPYVRDINVFEQDATNPLCSAVCVGNFELVKFLVEEKGANVNVQSGEFQETPLMIASWNGYKEIVELLLGYGADVTLRSTLGLLAFDCAVEEGYIEIAKILSDCGGGVETLTDKGSFIMHSYHGLSDNIAQGSVSHEEKPVEVSEYSVDLVGDEASE